MNSVTITTTRHAVEELRKLARSRRVAFMRAAKHPLPGQRRDVEKHLATAAQWSQVEEECAAAIANALAPPVSEPVGSSEAT